MKVSEILNQLESFAPPVYQENYDNAQLIVGDKNAECTGVLVSLDCIESVVQEAIDTGCNLIVSHHPIVFSGLKSLTGKNYVERTIIKAIQHNICLYAIHTNLDNIKAGVNAKIAEKLGLVNTQILKPKKGFLYKLTVFGTSDDITKIKEAVFNVGGGEIGEYSNCSFVSCGMGSFKPSEKSNPTIGEANKLEVLREDRCEIVIEKAKLSACLAAAKNASSYEELAYDIVALENSWQDMGSGMIGELPEEKDPTDLLKSLKKIFNVPSIKYSGKAESIKRVALCGGAGFFLLPNAIGAKADIFISSDVKYHEFFDAETKIILADIGHYESEQYTIELIAEFLNRKFPTFAVRLTSINTNPVNYI